MAHFRMSRRKRPPLLGLYDQIPPSQVSQDLKGEMNLLAHHLRGLIFASCAAHAESGSSLPCDQRKV